MGGMLLNLVLCSSLLLGGISGGAGYVDWCGWTGLGWNVGYRMDYYKSTQDPVYPFGSLSVFGFSTHYEDYSANCDLALSLNLGGVLRFSRTIGVYAGMDLAMMPFWSNVGGVEDVDMSLLALGFNAGLDFTASQGETGKFLASLGWHHYPLLGQYHRFGVNLTWQWYLCGRSEIASVRTGKIGREAPLVTAGITLK